MQTQNNKTSSPQLYSTRCEAVKTSKTRSNVLNCSQKRVLSKACQSFDPAVGKASCGQKLLRLGYSLEDQACLWVIGGWNTTRSVGGFRGRIPEAHKARCPPTYQEKGQSRPGGGIPTATCVRHFLPKPSKTKNRSCLSSCPAPGAARWPTHPKS